MDAANRSDALSLVPSDREVVLTRILAAPRELVFTLWTDPQHLAQWWGPKDFTNPVCEIEAKPGGAIWIIMRGSNGSEYPMRGVFREIVAPERLVFTAIPEDKAGNTLLEILTTVTFAELDGKTTVTVLARCLKETDAAAPMLAGMEAGWTQSLERLAIYAERAAEATAG